MNSIYLQCFELRNWFEKVCSKGRDMVMVDDSKQSKIFLLNH